MSFFSDFTKYRVVILCSNNLFPVFWNTAPVQHLVQLQNKQNPNDFRKNCRNIGYMIENAETCLCFMLYIDIRTVIVRPCTEKCCVAVMQDSSYFSCCWWKTRKEDQHGLWRLPDGYHRSSLVWFCEQATRRGF